MDVTEGWTDQNILGLVALAVSIIGIIPSTIAAFASVSAARAAHRQAKIMDASGARKMPVIVCRVTLVSGEPNWRKVRCEVTNLAEAPILVRTIRTRSRRILAHPGNVPQHPKPMASAKIYELNAGDAKREIDVDLAVAPAGTRPSGDRIFASFMTTDRQVTEFFLYLSCRSIGLKSGWTRASGVADVAFNCSWSDRMDRRFSLSQKIQLPATINDDTP